MISVQKQYQYQQYILADNKQTIDTQLIYVG